MKPFPAANSRFLPSSLGLARCQTRPESLNWDAGLALGRVFSYVRCNITNNLEATDRCFAVEEFAFSAQNIFDALSAYTGERGRSLKFADIETVCLHV
jgi:hypothetical protein